MHSAVQTSIVPARPTPDAVADRATASPPRELPAKSEAPRRRLSQERQRQLEVVIRQRIESRLNGRLRNLVVRVAGDTVVLEGQCATYYTKQLAQHAALGVLEDEHLENAIVVSVPR